MEKMKLYKLPEETLNGSARAEALKAVSQGQSATPTSAVSYFSEGLLLIIGSEENALTIANQLHNQLRCVVSLPPEPSGAAQRDSVGVESLSDVSVIRQKIVGLSGHLGQFTATVSTAEGELNLAKALNSPRETYDLVLDLTTPALINYEVAPPGYYAPQEDATALEKALTEIPTMVGEFEKPKFFNYNPNICAHGNSGISGCTNCLDTCPTNAIHSLGDLIEVNPYLCQGAGSCATACPTGAITYAYPKFSDLLAKIKQVLRVYREYRGECPYLLFHDGESGQLALERWGSELPEYTIPIRLEELGSVGMDIWLASLAYGANRVLLLVTDSVPHSVLQTVKAQVSFAQAMLAGMGHDSERISILFSDQPITDLISSLSPNSEVPPATFVGMEEKRNTIRVALDHLYKHSPKRHELTPLPTGAPFGEISVNRETCTLCMSCVSVCPSSALLDGKDTPKLSFIEWNCVQCGLCEKACPERAITQHPRILYQQDARMRPMVLNEEEPFRCISCGKPFATISMMKKMSEKLKGHWMYQDAQSMRRLQMCEDCRVKDMMIEEAGTS